MENKNNFTDEQNKFINDYYFIVYGKTFIPHRPFNKESNEEKYVNTKATNDSMAVKLLKVQSDYNYSKEAFAKVAENYKKNQIVDIFYCVEEKRFFFPTDVGLKCLNIASLRKEYAKELNEFKIKNRSIINQIEHQLQISNIVKNELYIGLIESAIELPEIEFNKENYEKLFPNRLIESPIERVLLGENQFKKLEVKKRERFLGLVYETINNPSIVIDELRINSIDGSQDLSHNYIKSFIDKSKIEGFQSVIVNIQNNNVSITNHNRSLDNLLSKIKMPEQLVYLNPEVRQVIELHTQKEMVNPRYDFNLAIESAYSTDITRAYNSSYQRIPLLSMISDGSITLKESLIPQNVQTQIFSEQSQNIHSEPIEVIGKHFETNPDGKFTLESFKEIAKTMEIYSDKHYETARYLFVKDGQILRHIAVSSQTPASTIIKPDDNFLYQLKSYAKQTESKIVFLHNHPSGYVEPSEADINLTSYMQNFFKESSGEDLFAGHIILDHGTYGLYNAEAKEWKALINNELEPLSKLSESFKLQLTKYGMRTNNVNDAISAQSLKQLSEYAKNCDSINMWNTKDWIPSFLMSGNGIVTSLEYINVRELEDYKNLSNKLKTLGRNYGSENIVLLPQHQDQFLSCERFAQLTGKVKDIYFENPDGSYKTSQFRNGNIFNDLTKDEIKVQDTNDNPELVTEKIMSENINKIYKENKIMEKTTSENIFSNEYDKEKEINFSDEAMDLDYEMDKYIESQMVNHGISDEALERDYEEEQERLYEDVDAIQRQMDIDNGIIDADGNILDNRTEELSKVIVFDTETTGFEAGEDELLQISIADGNGETIFNSYVKPENKTSWEEAMKVNGITPEMVKDAPTIKELLPELQKIFDNAQMFMSYNGRFDVNFFEAAGLHINENIPHLDVIKSSAAITKFPMKSKSDKRSIDGYHYPKLVDVAKHFNIDYKAHDSMGDTLATLQVAKNIYGENLEGLTPDILKKYTIDEKSVSKVEKKQTKSVDKSNKYLKGYLIREKHPEIIEEIKNNPGNEEIKDLLGKLEADPKVKNVKTRLNTLLTAYAEENYPEQLKLEAEEYLKEKASQKKENNTVVTNFSSQSNAENKTNTEIDSIKEELQKQFKETIDEMKKQYELQYTKLNEMLKQSDERNKELQSQLDMMREQIKETGVTANESQAVSGNKSIPGPVMQEERSNEKKAANFNLDTAYIANTPVPKFGRIETKTDEFGNEIPTGKIEIIKNAIFERIIINDADSSKNEIVLSVPLPDGNHREIKMPEKDYNNIIVAENKLREDLKGMSEDSWAWMKAHVDHDKRLLLDENKYRLNTAEDFIHNYKIHCRKHARNPEEAMKIAAWMVKRMTPFDRERFNKMRDSNRELFDKKLLEEFELASKDKTLDKSDFNFDMSGPNELFAEASPELIELKPGELIPGTKGTKVGTSIPMVLKVKDMFNKKNIEVEKANYKIMKVSKDLYPEDKIILMNEKTKALHCLPLKDVVTHIQKIEKQQIKEETKKLKKDHKEYGYEGRS